MKIVNNGSGELAYREIQAAKGKFLKQGTSYFTKRTMLLKETENDYEEVDSIPETDTGYSGRIIALVRAKYSIDDELAILRQRDTKPEEFKEYDGFVEECKVRAKDN
ncbi:MAG: hypothetical protein E6767_20310 [Dysgonomonas sp.]|nr:hypothetical protein [Dysgonomonas sp.]